MSNGNISKLKGIIFDWDGTIVDSAQAMFLSYRHAYSEHLGIEFPRNEEEFRTLVPMRLAESSARFGGERAADIAVSYNLHYETQAYKTGRVFDGMREILEQLRGRGYLLAVASNKSLGRISTDIEYLGLQGLVDTLVTSEDTVERKPHPAPLLKAAEKLALAPGACAYVGDYRGDVLAARQAGMVSVAALWGGVFLPDSLYAEQPDFALRQPEELLGIFCGMNIPEAIAPNSQY